VSKTYLFNFSIFFVKVETKFFIKDSETCQ